VRPARPRRNRQRGAALLALLVVVVLAFAYVLTSRLRTGSGQIAANRAHNAKVLNQAKQALIGFMVMRAAQAGEDDPGSLPCPEAPGNAGNPALEGIAAGNCAVPAVGRLPWRTLGLDKLVDAHSEPLWYVVSPGWHKPNSTTNTVVNSDSIGQLTVDGAANNAVALIVAPGRAMNVQAAPGCTARSQARAAPAPGMDARDYLECFDAAAPAFSTAGPAGSFNDQVLKVIVADLVPPLEAAIAYRMQREIAPALKSVYASAQWGVSATNPVFPFAASWTNPGTSNYRGVSGRYRGLLPFVCSAPGCASDARFAPTFVSWNTGFTPTATATNGSGTSVGVGISCSFPTPSTVRCTGTYVSLGTVTLRIRNLRANNVGMALRRLDPTKVIVEYGLLGCGSATPGTAASASLQNNGSADLTLEGQAPGLIGGPLLLPLSVNFCMTADLGVLADHSLLDKDDSTTGWFVRNEWYRLVYYAVAQENTPDDLPYGAGFGCDSSSCLRFNDFGTRNIRALLVLAGRSLSNPAGRPNGTLSDYLEFQNCDFNGTSCDPQTLFEQRPIRSSDASVPAINAPWNDRIVLVDWIAPAPTFPLATLP